MSGSNIKYKGRERNKVFRNNKNNPISLLIVTYYTIYNKSNLHSIM